MQGLDFEYKNEAAEKVTKEKQEGGGEVSKFAYTDAEKTKSVLKIDHECSNINSAWTFANDKLVGEVTGTLLDDDWKVNAGVGYETKKAKGEWRCGGFLDFASPDMSGIKAALHVSKSLALCIQSTARRICEIRIMFSSAAQNQFGGTKHLGQN